MIIGIDIRLIGKQRTGDEAVFFNLTKEFAQMDTDHKFELFTDETDENRLAEISKRLEIENRDNFKIISIKSKNKFLWNFWDLPRCLRKNPTDVYLTQYITPFFVPRKIHHHTNKEKSGFFSKEINNIKNKYIEWRIKYFGVGVKIITIVHDISFNFFSQYIRKSDLFFLKMLIPLSLRRADKILGVSEFTKNEIIKYYKINPKKVDFFHNAVGEDFKKQDISERKISEVRKKYKLPEKFILYLGTLQPRKNIPFLLESYASLKGRIDGIKLVIVGSRNAHNYDFNIDKKIEEYGLEKDVIFPGFVDEEDKAAVYASARVFVFPSLYEGFGIPIVESFSVGTPILASNIGSLREVAENGALFADPGNVDKFSKALYDIIVDEKLRKNLIALGKNRAEFFSWQKTAEKVLAILDSIKK